MIHQLQYNRLLLLVSLYKSIEGSTRVVCDARALAIGLGINMSDFIKAYDFLEQENLISQHGSGYHCLLNHAAIKLVEFSMENPTSKSAYFLSIKDLGISF